MAECESVPILGTCDYCHNSNRQQLKRLGDEYLCSRCYEDRRRGSTGGATIAKRRKDQKFLNDYKSVVRGRRG